MVLCLCMMKSLNGNMECNNNYRVHVLYTHVKSKKEGKLYGKFSGIWMYLVKSSLSHIAYQNEKQFPESINTVHLKFTGM